MSEPAPDPPVRPRYREGQLLQACDLLDEQAYRIRMRRSHVIGEHRWGIAQGLELVARADGGVTLRPGAAVDGYGRTLLVPEPVEVPASALGDPGPPVDFWLGYCREPVTPAQRGTWACGPGRDSRWRERAVLRLSQAGDAAVDPRRPPGVPPPDLDFPPHRAPPDDPDRRWPVYLGRLSRQVPSVSGARPYVGLVGETVAAPSGQVRMQVGDEGRFAVAITGPATPAGSGGPSDRLIVDSSGMTVTGHTTVAGALRLAPADEGAASPNRVVFEPAPISGAAAPWTISHASASAGASHRQLRIEIRHPGKQGDPATYRLAIGRTVGRAFSPCLSVDANCRTTIYGDLVAKGRIAPGPIPANPDDPRFVTAVIDRWTPGLSTAASGVETWYNTSLKVAIEATGTPRAGMTFTYQLKVTNTGRVAVTTIAVIDTLTIGDSPPQLTRSTVDLLLPELTTTFDRTVTPPSGSAGLSVTATVLGVGPVLPPVSATASSHFDIDGQVGEPS